MESRHMTAKRIAPQDLVSQTGSRTVRDLVAMMAEHGVFLAPSTILRRVRCRATRYEDGDGPPSLYFWASGKRRSNVSIVAPCRTRVTRTIAKVASMISRRCGNCAGRQIGRADV